MQNKHILLSSSILPGWGTGTRIILKRHLEMLERKGWHISVIVPESYLKLTKDFPKTWNVVFLPFRRWWWLPYRQEVRALRNFRLSVFQYECEKTLKGNLPTAILTHLSGSIYVELASYLSKEWGVPLSVLCHDREEFFANSDLEFSSVKQKCESILMQAQQSWFVSPELEQSYNLKSKKKTSVLLPIPEFHNRKFIEWQSKFSLNPVVAHAGWLYPSQFSNFYSLAMALQEINGSVLIVCPKDNPTLIKLLETCSNILHHDTFQTNSDVLNFLEDNATCILVSYSFIESEQPWASTSFPSKLVEFSHLGLPVIIMAPRNIAISNWAESHSWIGYIDYLGDQIIRETISNITKREKWLLMAKQTREVALNEFHPERIQRQFESELARLDNYD
jgi:hypothetical protein